MPYTQEKQHFSYKLILFIVYANEPGLFQPRCLLLAHSKRSSFKVLVT